MAIARLSVKVGHVGKAAPHSDYIDRGAVSYELEIEVLEEIEAESQTDLVYAEFGNMPEWSEHHPRAFWQAADLYERKNGSTYREYEVALPRELSPDQQKKLVQDFVGQEIGNKYPYQFAIHNPKALDGGEQPHAHIMFNERVQDGIARDPEQYFKRYNAKEPERGGAKKDNTGKDAQTRTEELKALRMRWQELCNAHLELADLSVRIDMRSYEDQEVDKIPERKYLPSEFQQPEKRAELIEFRAAKHEIDATQVLNIKTDLAAEEKAALWQTQLTQGKNDALSRFKAYKAEKNQQAQEKEKQLEKPELSQKTNRGFER